MRRGRLRWMPASLRRFPPKWMRELGSRCSPMGSITPAVTVPTPAGWTPQRAMAVGFPAIAQLRQETQPEIRAMGARLDREEARGCDTFCLRQVLRELRWRLEYTADAVGVRSTLERLRPPAALPSRPGAAGVGGVGNYVAGTESCF